MAEMDQLLDESEYQQKLREFFLFFWFKSKHASWSNRDLILARCSHGLAKDVFLVCLFLVIE